MRRYENPKAPQKRSFVGLDSNAERDIADTSARKELTRERDTVEEQHRSQLAEIHQEINQASKENDARTKQEMVKQHTLSWRRNWRGARPTESASRRTMSRTRTGSRRSCGGNRLLASNRATEKGIHTSKVERQQMTCRTVQLKSENTDGGEVFSVRRFRVLIHDVLDVTIVATVLRKSTADFWKCAATD